MTSNIKLFAILFSLTALLFACEGLETINDNNPDREDLLSSGADLQAVLSGAYIAWWQGVHDDHPVIALSITADAYSMSWADFGAFRMGQEPRTFYNNRISEDPDYKKVALDPWFGCLSAVSGANDVLRALENGVTIDEGGAQDLSVNAAAHFLRGVSWGYLGLIFDEALLVDQDTDLTTPVPFSGYRDMTQAAVTELEEAIETAELAGGDFTFQYFNGLNLRLEEFQQLAHSYAARFLAQWPRTEEENALVDWEAVLSHASSGLEFDFAPLADGSAWMSYQKYVFAETGEGPLWARVDQRLVAAMDPSQPARYPEVFAKGEAPLENPMATSPDARLESDFVFLPQNNFPIDRGEWFFSHYKHNRNKTQPGFAGNGSTDGPMPVFLAADNQLLQAEALLRLGRKGEAITLIDNGTRVERGQLPPLPRTASTAEVEEAILYERAIELLSTAPMSLWFDRRRFGPREDYLEVTPLGGLQIGTPAQLPVPADELQVQGLEPYNYGGPMDPLGIEKIY